MAKKTEPIVVDGTEIRISMIGGQEFLCLTDIARRFGDDTLIYNWIRNRNTVEYLGIWEELFNPDFKGIEFERFRKEAGLNNFSLSPKKWIDATAAIGLVSRAGRYDGGTFAHRDIALEFCSWMDTRFKLYLIKEFQRLKIEESQREALESSWDLRRELSKINYRFHTDAIRNHLIPPRFLSGKAQGLVFASEADLLNTALFGMTAQEWKLANPALKGNLRDHATAGQLLVLANLENLNAHFIKEGLAQDERLEKLNEVAIYQLSLLASTDSDRLLLGG